MRRPARPLREARTRRGRRAGCRRSRRDRHPAQQRRGAVALLAELAAQRVEHREHDARRRSPRAHANGPRGWLSPSTMPSSTSSARADALADREARLVDELGDDPPEHEAGRVAHPRRVQAERGEAVLRALGRQRRRSSVLRASSTSPVASSGASTWKPTRDRRRRRGRAASRPRTAARRAALQRGARRAAAVERSATGSRPPARPVAHVEAGLRAPRAQLARDGTSPRGHDERALVAAAGARAGPPRAPRGAGRRTSRGPLLRPRRPAATIRALSGEGRQRGSPKLSS